MLLRAGMAVCLQVPVNSTLGVTTWRGTSRAARTQLLQVAWACDASRLLGRLRIPRSDRAKGSLTQRRDLPTTDLSRRGTPLRRGGNHRDRVRGQRRGEGHQSRHCWSEWNNPWTPSLGFTRPDDRLQVRLSAGTGLPFGQVQDLVRLAHSRLKRQPFTTAVTPNMSFNRTPYGSRPCPRYALVHVAPRGHGRLPPWAG